MKDPTTVNMLFKKKKTLYYLFHILWEEWDEYLYFTLFVLPNNIILPQVSSDNYNMYYIWEYKLHCSYEMD